MVMHMLSADWERTRRQLAAIADAVRLQGLTSVDLDLAAAKRSLEDRFNPLQAGVELIAMADDLVNIPDLWNRTVALASELLCFPTVEKAVRVRAKSARISADFA